jgi:hypothetical protein
VMSNNTVTSFCSRKNFMIWFMLFQSVNFFEKEKEDIVQVAELSEGNQIRKDCMSKRIFGLMPLGG